MSIGYILACRQPPPIVWKNAAQPSYDHIEFDVYPPKNPPDELRTDRLDSYVCFLHFSGSAARLDTDFIWYFVERLADWTNGDVFSDEDSQIFYEGSRGAIKEIDFDAWWHKRREQYERRAHRKREREQQRYLELRQQRIERSRQNLKENNWSDRLPPETRIEKLAPVEPQSSKNEKQIKNKTSR